MQQCFDYQASPRLDMTFKTYIKENIIFYFIYLLLLLFQRIKTYEKKQIFNYQDKNKGKEKG